MATGVLKWGDRSSYVLTELVLFGLNIAVLLAIAFLSSGVILSHLKKGRSFFTSLYPLLEMILSSSIGFVPARGYSGEDKIDVVFMGFQEDTHHDSSTESEKSKRKQLVRIWVRVYFVILCGLIVMWTLSVFSYSVLYTKTSSCTDMSVTDKDLTCFQLSHRDTPEAVQDIIDEEEGDLVPCGAVYQYLLLHNISYDLEVICYHYHLDLFAALGLSYGAMKSISFIITVILTAILMATTKCCSRHMKEGSGRGCCRGSWKKKAAISQLLLLLCSFLAVVVFGTVVGFLHSLTNTRNTTFDFLRGETFDRYTSVFFFVPFTIFYTLGVFPWWAFKRLQDPPSWDTANLSQEDISKKLNNIIHYIVLHERFSTDYIFNAKFHDPKLLDQIGRSVPDVARRETETAL